MQQIRRDGVSENGLRRTFWFNPHLDEYEEGSSREILVPVEPAVRGVSVEAANLVSSQLYSKGKGVLHGLHSPVLDIDFRARLEPSSTDGHFHLYLDGLVMPWAEYRQLLRALGECGVIERAYLEACERREMSCVRPPGVTKRARPTAGAGR